MLCPGVSVRKRATRIQAQPFELKTSALEAKHLRLAGLDFTKLYASAVKTNIGPMKYMPHHYNTEGFPIPLGLRSNAFAHAISSSIWRPDSDSPLDVSLASCNERTVQSSRIQATPTLSHKQLSASSNRSFCSVLQIPVSSIPGTTRACRQVHATHMRVRQKLTARHTHDAGTSLA